MFCLIFYFYITFILCHLIFQFFWYYHEYICLNNCLKEICDQVITETIARCNYWFRPHCELKIYYKETIQFKVSGPTLIQVSQTPIDLNIVWSVTQTQLGPFQLKSCHIT